MKINANMSALVTNKRLHHVENTLQASMERLSSGLKLNHAKDNPAGMAISNKMRAQIAGLDRASNNASDAIAAVRVADGALNEVSGMLQRMRELSVQAANDTNTVEDKQAIQAEIDQIKTEIDRIAKDTEYNEISMIDGSLSKKVYAEHVSRISISDRVAPGTYILNVDYPATGAAAHTEGGMNIDPNDTETKMGIKGTLTINGASVEIEETDSYAQVYEKLEEVAIKAGVGHSASLYERTFFTTGYGQEERLRISFDSVDFAESLGFSGKYLRADGDSYVYHDPYLIDNPQPGRESHIPTGSEPKVTLNTNEEESAFSKMASVRTKGNRVTIIDKDGFEMSFLLEEGYSGPIEFEVTDMGTMSIHIGANEGQNMELSIGGASSKDLYVENIDVTKQDGAARAMGQIDDAIAKVSEIRSNLGAYENRLEYSVASLDSFEENMTEAQSRLADTDMAEEMTIYTQQNVLNQAAISVLTQANDMPQQILQLLQ